MSKIDLFDYMRNATREMQSEYERIQKRVLEDPGTAGDNGEENWADLFRSWLPKEFHIVTKGRIINEEGQCGPQVDVLILSPSYPPALLNKKEYLAGGVIAAFECKLTLRSTHIAKAVESAAKIRRICRKPSGTPYGELVPPIKFGLLTHSHSWITAKSSPVDIISGHLDKAERQHVEHPNEVLDLICVSDLATWSTNRLLITGGKISQLEQRYEHLGKEFEKHVEAGGLIETVHVVYSGDSQESPEEVELFTPIGSCITHLYKQLAYLNPNLRPIAEHFIRSKLTGIGAGDALIWPLSTLSEYFRKRLSGGEVKYTSGTWSENNWYY
jgi:hypothetical protein